MGKGTGEGSQYQLPNHPLKPGMSRLGIGILVQAGRQHCVLDSKQAILVPGCLPTSEHSLTMDSALLLQTNPPSLASHSSQAILSAAGQPWKGSFPDCEPSHNAASSLRCSESTLQHIYQMLHYLTEEALKNWLREPSSF